VHRSVHRRVETRPRRDAPIAARGPFPRRPFEGVDGCLQLSQEVRRELVGHERLGERLRLPEKHAGMGEQPFVFAVERHAESRPQTRHLGRGCCWGDRAHPAAQRRARRQLRDRGLLLASAADQLARIVPLQRVHFASHGREQPSDHGSRREEIPARGAKVAHTHQHLVLRNVLLRHDNLQSRTTQYRHED
jgi:hypothetical protein